MLHRVDYNTVIETRPSEAAQKLHDADKDRSLADKEQARMTAVMRADKAEATAVAAQNELLDVTKRWASDWLLGQGINGLFVYGWWLRNWRAVPFLSCWSVPTASILFAQMLLCVSKQQETYQ